MDTYRNPLWPTRDRVIPMQLFFVLMESIGNVQAAEELQAYYATLLAAAQVWGGKDAQPDIQRAIRELRRTAYPRRAVKPVAAASTIVVAEHAGKGTKTNAPEG